MQVLITLISTVVGGAFLLVGCLIVAVLATMYLVAAVNGFNDRKHERLMDMHLAELSRWCAADSKITEVTRYLSVLNKGGHEEITRLRDRLERIETKQKAGAYSKGLNEGMIHYRRAQYDRDGGKQDAGA